MELTETQFRLLKSRAKARLGKLCQSRIAVTVGARGVRFRVRRLPALLMVEPGGEHRLN